MDNDNSLLKWTGAAVGTVVVCFLLGYFILPKGGGAQEPSPQIAAASPTPSPSPMPLQESTTKPLKLKDITEADAEARRKEEERKAAEAAQAALAASPSPTPEAPPDENGTEVVVDNPPTSGDAPPPTPEPTPEPKSETPRPTPPSPPVRTVPDALYRVRVGDSYATRDDAESLAGELRGRGFQPIVIKAGKGFAVQVGAFKERKGAEEKQKELTNNGYDARIK